MNFKNSFLFLRSATLCIDIHNNSFDAHETHGELFLDSKQIYLLKENVLEVKMDDLCSVEQECDLSFLIALLKDSRLDLNISVIFTMITCPGMLEPERKQ